jgi:proteasome lid subunit RPN8/RPN11
MLFMPETLGESLKAFARQGYPHETCGLLLGVRRGDEHVVSRVRRARNLNVERAEDRYELDPADFLAADREARAAGQDIVGIWHSHPNNPARPSATDRDGAWPGWSYLIVSVGREGTGEIRSWRLNGGDFEEEKITT